MSAIQWHAPVAGFAAKQLAFEQAALRVLHSGQYILGSEVTHFEAEFLALIDALHSQLARTNGQRKPMHESHAAIAVANGTDALVLALLLHGIGPGDCVLTVSHTAGATVSAIRQVGATAILVDVDPNSMTMDPNNLTRVIAEYRATHSLRAIIVVHLYGHAAQMTEIAAIAQAHELPVIEDCAQALGATWHGQAVGSFGAAAAFSFYPTKNLGAFGDAGCVLVRQELAGRVRALRQFGWHSAQDSTGPGVNSRMDELQAAFLRVGLAHFLSEQAARHARVMAYQADLSARSIPGLTLPLQSADPHPEQTQHAWHQFVIRLPKRDKVLAALREQGIPAQVHYPKAVHQQSGFQPHILLPSAGLPVTEQLLKEIISLPLHAHLPMPAVSHVVQTLADIVAL